MTVTLNKPLAFGPDHYARCTAHALTTGRSIDIQTAIYDFRACGAYECARLVKKFARAIYWPERDNQSALKARLFRFKISRRWAEFEEQLASHREGLMAQYTLGDKND